MSSAINLAKVFAERCKRSGITTLNYLKGVSFDTSTKVIENNGLVIFKLLNNIFIQKGKSILQYSSRKWSHFARA